MDRTPAINALRQTKVFRNASFRLLADLIEKAEDEIGPDVRGKSEKAAIVLFLEDGDADDGYPQRRYRGVADWPGQPNFKDHRRTVPPRKNGRVLRLTESFLLDSHKASLSLFSSLDLEGFEEYRKLADQRAGIPVHAVWLCERQDLGAPLEAMAQLLAASIVRDFHEPAAVLSVQGQRIKLAVWENGELVPRALPRQKQIDQEALGKALKGAGPLCHVFVVGLSPGDPVPGALADLLFHRIVYVTDQVPGGVHADFEQRLVPKARNQRNPAAPYFSSFVASVVKTKENLGQGKPFSEQIEGHDPDDLARAAARRVDRDLCRIPFDLDDLKARWTAAVRDGSTATFAADLLAERADCRTIASRWARAMTNRAVGLAVSGGGATSYRMVALLENFAHRDVPIDVISGISGGALVGAYYCLKGHEGLEMCVARGPSFQRRILAALFDGRWFRDGIDCDLGYASVDDVDVRFVPVATALRDGKPPQARVISGGTLGEAVHASGAAPGLFSPMCRNGAVPPDEVIRYTDGVSSRLIPARAVAEYGADLVIAYNTIPTPERRNPFDESRLGQWIYDKTPASRVIDFAVSWLFMLAQCSREVAEDAHHFIEPVEENEPFCTAFRFDRAAAIVEEARADMSLINEAKVCADRWEEFCAAPAFPAYWTPPPPPPAPARKSRKAKKKATGARSKTHARKATSARKKRSAPKKPRPSKKPRRPKKPRPPKK